MNRALILVSLLAGPTAAADAVWPQFRGPEGRASSQLTNLPEKFDAKDNLRWKSELPGRGLSCPVIAGGRVFLTANSGMDQNRLHVLAIDLASGKILWERQFWATGQTLCHPKTCMACPTIATDGTTIAALFATGDLVGLTTDGDVKWVRSLSNEYPKMTNHVGRSSSPVLAGNTLAVLMENQGDSYLFGVDLATGTTNWKVARPLQNNWNTPLVVRNGSKDQIVVSGYEDVTAYDAATGKVEWSFNEKGLNPIVTPVSAGDMLLIPTRGLIALKPGDGGAKVVWKGTKLGCDTPTPVVADGKVYSLARNILKCGDLSNGEQLWDLRVPGPLSASPLFADGKVYLVSEDGKVTVVRPDSEAKILSTSELKETILATPAIADGAMFFRSDKHLWCFHGGKKTS